MNVIELDPADLNVKWFPPEGFTVELDPDARIAPRLRIVRLKRIRLRAVADPDLTTQVFEVVEGF